MKQQRPRVIYLLHFENALKGKHHYMGICYEDRLEARLQEHAKGVGSPFTRELAKLNVEFYCSRLWHNATYEEEKRRKMSANLKRSCPLCRTGQLDLTMLKLETNVRLGSSIVPSGFSFAEPPAKTRSENPMKKGGRRS